MGNEIQKDLVLAPNEYAYVLDETKGNISCNVGPHKMSLSQSDRLVRFDSSKKKFIPCDRYEDAIQLFTVAPEGWYVALKNPVSNNKHPSIGTSNSIPEDMKIGYKVNIPGPVSFALYPGQMAQVIRGHSLRSNQYLVARVYDADSLNNDNEGSSAYVNGQTLIIKGTETSFYVPPTGIEVKAINNDIEKGYVRDAVTLERLEYCILKDEDGNKRYVHGPEVVFPLPTETFIKDDKNNIKRNAIELSDISGVYVKVIADYKDEKGKEHKTGEELFITGRDQMIYYPRPEHTFISYNGKIVNNGIAIPKGEGRYIMNRMTGEIKTVRGPAMYLADPRVEVAVKRVLTRKQCDLWYPGNQNVLEANGHSIIAPIADAYKSLLNSPVVTFSDGTMCCASDTSYYNGTPTKKESNKINRSNTFTQPRTISLESSKYEGAVAIDVWTGYAVNVISKDGKRNVVCGPQTVLLDYDQTLEMLELSTGKPKTTDNLEQVVFLRHENNRVSDIINVETSDFVKAAIKVSYLVNFDKQDIEKWFSVDNYVKHMCDWARSTVKKAVKEFTITELCDGSNEIVVSALTDEDSDTTYLHKFNENGMKISDVEILSLSVEDGIQKLIDEHQSKIVARALELNAEKQSSEVEANIIAINREKVRLNEEYNQFKADQEAASLQRKFEIAVAHKKANDDEAKRQQEFNIELQKMKDEIFRAEQARIKQEREEQLEHEKALNEINADREAKAAQSIKVVLEAIGPQLAAALNNSNNQETIEAIAKAISPYAIANGMPVAEAISTMLRGTGLEQIMSNFVVNRDWTN